MSSEGKKRNRSYRVLKAQYRDLEFILSKLLENFKQMNMTNHALLQPGCTSHDNWFTCKRGTVGTWQCVGPQHTGMCALLPPSNFVGWPGVEYRRCSGDNVNTSGAQRNLCYCYRKGSQLAKIQLHHLPEPYQHTEPSSKLPQTPLLCLCWALNRLWALWSKHHDFLILLSPSVLHSDWPG